jgi:OmcA/MtrC family decaheme c-type cytochrome
VSCTQPSIGERVTTPPESEGPKIAIDEAWIDLHGHAVVSFHVSQDDVPLVLAEVTALVPKFTLARLTSHPSDFQREWESLLPIGANVVPVLQPGGPDDPNVLTNVQQPGAETGTTLVDNGDGSFRYVYAQSLSTLVPTETVRIGMWLSAVESPTDGTSATYDFSPSGGLVEERDAVLDDNCIACHGRHPVAHETISGVRLCLTCHTWQAADPFTLDPAAMVTAGSSPTKNPNPLELGRLVHRIHRGKELPTLYQTAWDGTNFTSCAVPSATGLPNPYIPYRPFNPARTILPGRKFSVIASDGREVVYGSSGTVYSIDPSVALSQTLASGGLFPRDLRDCDVCHRDAKQSYIVKYGISRRTCTGCHPEVWFQATSPAADRVRFPHAGGPQADDSGCRGCHVDNPGTPKLYAPIEEIHVVPARAPRYNLPVLEIVQVDGLVPGGQPKVTFRVTDREGPLWPSLNAPQPAFEPAGLPSSSYVARGFPANGLLIKVQGPTVPDYTMFGTVLNSGAANGNPDPMLSTSVGTDEYVYTFSSVLPPGTSGTFIVGMEARRSVAAPAAVYDKVNDAFRWPYTHEPVNESADNVYVYVNTATGTWAQAGGSPGAVPRRTVVDQQKCLRCHDRIEFHGPARHQVQWCVTCHTADMADLDKRVSSANAGRRYANGPVRIGGTYDGIEERSTQLKMHIHRLHTGNRTGAASLEGIAPYVVYFGKAYYFDRGGFPGDLRNCTLCHLGKSYLPENVPADAPPTRANETAVVYHPNTGVGNPTVPFPHPPDEPATPPLQAACLGCHATGPAMMHAAEKTVNGVETCTSCHSKGAEAVELVHGLVKPTSTAVAASFSAIRDQILVPRCATSACHASGSVYPTLEAASAYDALVSAPSFEASMPLVTPSDVTKSYLDFKLRGDMSSAGGSGSIMPPDGALAPADIAAIEAWIANGAPND